MKPSALLGLVGLAAAASAADGAVHRSVRRDHDANDYYVLHLSADTPPDQIARQLGLFHEGQLGELADHHVFSGAKATHDVVQRELQQRRRKRSTGGSTDALDGVLYAQKQTLHRRLEKRIPPVRFGPSLAARADDKQDTAALQKQQDVMAALDIHDPIFHEQWHLLNTVQVGHDVNVTDVWRQGITGRNTTVAIVDDGLDMYSDDLKANYYAKGSYDFNEKTEEPKPRLSDDRHGTRCAGEVSAVRNDVCGVGVAYDSRIAGLRILSKAITDADEAVALNYDFQNNQIYSCSWGPPDDGKSMDAPGLLIRRAMLNAVQNGRGGLGSIYVFASGNGAAADDNCNFDGYTNSIYSITVGAIDRKGEHPYYSEKCSASLVVTYSSGGGDAIHTTDVGTNQCYNQHGGTSAAAPLAAGIFALALQVRPDLTWRDMQYLVMMTAVPVQLDSGDWQDTFIGRKYSHTYAYGKVDSYALVEAARTWQLVKPQAWYYSPWIHVHKPIPEGNAGLAVAVDVAADALRAANLARIEHVTVTLNIDHQRRGDISVDLISPNNIVSHLSVTRKPDNTPEGYVDWTFMSVVHWGESGVGTWKLVVKDENVNGKTGNLTDFHLKLWGEAADAGKATLLPMPTEDEDNNHDITSTTTVAASTTTLPSTSATSAAAGTSTVLAVPSDHPARPTKPATSTTATTATTASAPASTGTDSASEHETAPSPSASGNNPVSWMPAFLGNMSTKKQIWIYGALGLIAAFCVGLGVYFFLARRRRLRNSPRDNYEFELLDEEEGEALNAGSDRDEDGRRPAAAGLSEKRRKATRGGELYDAFADGSDEDEYGLASEDEDDGHDYHGRAAAAPQAPAPAPTSAPAPRASADNEPEHHVIGDDSGSEESDESDESEEEAPARDQDRSRLL